MLVLLAVLALGLSAGALVAEGAVLVPFWRSLQPESFLAWYRQHATLLLRFFGPLEIVAASLAVVAALVSWLGDEPASGLLAISAVLAVLAQASCHSRTVSLRPESHDHRQCAAVGGRGRVVHL